ncbi:hypothetical protein MY4038_006002 [Beauveria bassiana]
MPPSSVDLGGLQTENSNPRTATIDKVSTEELCRILHEEDCRVPAAVTPCLPEIAATIDALTERVRKGGRVFYIGAGTSGRLGVLDASEIPPTYSSPPNQFIALIAGGDYALRNAKEGAEDDRSAARTDLDAFNIAPNLDSLIGIASSGRTPYVLGGLEYARSIGCTTVGVVCVQPSAMATEGNADYLISAVTGSESVTGSTRMKAGTATKLVLNMISTGIMIKLGKTYGNLMVDLKATNIKLRQRARNILRAIGGQRCHHSDQELDAILAVARGSTKLAAVMMILDVPLLEAELRLERNNGVLDRVFTEAEMESTWIGLAGYDLPAVQPSVNDGLSKLLNLKIGAGLEVTTDIDLLPVASASEETVESAVVLIAGTGSIAMSFRKENGAFVRSSRAGGWGHLLGDDGSGYSIGREALRLALRESDVCAMRKYASAPAQTTSQLARAVFDHFKEQFPEAKPEDLLSTVMMPNSAPQQPRDAVMDRTSRIAGVAKTVLAMVKTNEDADRIVAAGAEKLAELAALLVLNQGIKPSKASLVLAGGLMQDEGYRRRIVGSVERAGYKFQHVEVVDQPAMNGARFLLRSAQTLQ